jgi:hypothetical protein
LEEPESKLRQFLFGGEEAKGGASAAAATAAATATLKETEPLIERFNVDEDMEVYDGQRRPG